MAKQQTQKPSSGDRQDTFLEWVAFNATVFVASACIMTVEILSTRLVARHLGSSLYTWTSAIGVVLGGISLGNYIGGRLADRNHPRRTLSVLFVASSVACLTIPTLNAWIGSLTALDGLSWPTRIFVHFVLVFLAPSALLGTMSPVVAKMALGLDKGPGRTIGTIYAWGAVGSIVGTFVAGFFLIAWMGTEAAILSVAAVLALMGAIYGYRSWYPYASGVTTAAALLCAMGPWQQARALGSMLGLRPDTGESTVFLEDSRYQRVLVADVDGEGERWMVLDSLLHSKVNLRDPLDLQYDYEKIYAEVIRQTHPAGEALDALVLGGGGYVFPRYLELVYPNSRVEVAEIDPVVTRAAFEAFGLPADTRIKSFDLDARNYLSDRSRAGDDVPRLDYVFGDTFHDFNVPYHLTTVEFDRMLLEQLDDDGVYMLNVVDMYDSSRLLAAVYLTCREVFPEVQVVSATAKASARATFVVIGSMSALDLPGVVEAVRSQGPFAGELFDAGELRRLGRIGGKTLLTDDYAPVENLLAAAVKAHGRSGGTDIIQESAELIESGEYSEAVRRLRVEIKKRPSDAGLQNQLGQALAESGNVVEAVKAFELAVGRMPSSARFRANLGLACEQLGRDVDAVREYRECLRLDGQNLPVMITLARLLATSSDAGARDGEEAVRWAEQLNVRTGRQNPEALDALAVSYAEAGRFEEALRTAEQALAVSAQLPGLEQLIRRHQALFRQGRPVRN